VFGPGVGVYYHFHDSVMMLAPTLDVAWVHAISDTGSWQIGLNYNNPDRWGRTFLRFQNTFGFDWLGARHRNYGGTSENQPTGSNQFWKAELLANRLFRLPQRNLLFLRGYAQFTPDSLPPAEQFQLGGAYSVRGYTEGLLTGDRGYSLSAEWRWPVPFLRLISPWLADRIQGAIFADYGQAYTDQSNPNFIQTDYIRRLRTSLLSTGFGVRMRLTQYLSGFLDAGFGLLDRERIEPNAQPTARIHFGIRTDLIPEDYRTRGKDVVRVTRSPDHSIVLLKVEEPAAPATTTPAAAEDDHKPETVEFTPGGASPSPAAQPAMPVDTNPTP